MRFHPIDLIIMAGLCFWASHFIKGLSSTESSILGLILFASTIYVVGYDECAIQDNRIVKRRA